MASATNQTDKPEANDFKFPPIEMRVFNSNLIAPFAQVSQVYLENAMAWNQELMRFANERLEADVQAFQNISKGGSLEEFVNTQSDFTNSVADSYMEEVPKLLEHAVRACAPMWNSAEDDSKA